ncbi:MAG: FAD:protein FMN transferase, partial [Bdellovibrionales bacterium]
LVRLVKTNFASKGQPPRDIEIQKLRNRIDYKNILIENSSVRFKKPGMQITLDGIAKGYAVDEVSEILLIKGFKNHLVNFSGNMRWRGSPPGAKYWKVSLWNYKTKQAIQFFEKPQGAIASSGAEHASYSKDQLWNHILDPRQLAPPKLWLTTSVMGPEAQVCDALSTAAFVMTEEEIKLTFNKYFSEYQVWGQDLKSELRCLVGCS